MRAGRTLIPSRDRSDDLVERSPCIEGFSRAPRYATPRYAPPCPVRHHNSRKRHIRAGGQPSALERPGAAPWRRAGRPIGLLRGAVSPMCVGRGRSGVAGTASRPARGIETGDEERPERDVDWSSAAQLPDTCPLRNGAFRSSRTPLFAEWARGVQPRGTTSSRGLRGLGRGIAYGTPLLADCYSLTRPLRGGGRRAHAARYSGCAICLGGCHTCTP